ncbi:MAG: hypothetical protein ACRC7O_04915 [Fimbriiglobus sp.]
MFGYVAELVFKATVYSHFGMPPGDAIPERTFRLVEWMMARDAVGPSGPHHVLMWAEWMIRFSKPIMTGVAYLPEIGDNIRARASAIDTRWAPGLRYHTGIVSAAETVIVEESARWLLTHADQF